MAMTGAATPQPGLAMDDVATSTPASMPVLNAEPADKAALDSGPLRLSLLAAGLCLLVALGLGYLGWVRRYGA